MSMWLCDDYYLSLRSVAILHPEGLSSAVHMSTSTIFEYVVEPRPKNTKELISILISIKTSSFEDCLFLILLFLSHN